MPPPLEGENWNLNTSANIKLSLHPFGWRLNFILGGIILLFFTHQLRIPCQLRSKHLRSQALKCAHLAHQHLNLPL